MGNYWIRATQNNVVVFKNGQRLIFDSGDWIEVGRMEANTLVAEGKAEMIDYSILLAHDNVQVMVEGDPADTELFFNQVSVVGNDAKMDLPTVVIDRSYSYKSKDAPGMIRNPALFALAFDTLLRVDVLVAIADYKATVKDSNRELEACSPIVGDLRVLALQNCIAGFSGSETSQIVFEEWQRQKAQGGVHALLRAVHKIKPTIYYAPPHWGIK